VRVSFDDDVSALREFVDAPFDFSRILIAALASSASGSNRREMLLSLDVGDE